MRCHAAGVSDAAHPLLPPATPVLRAGTDGIQVGGVDSTDGLLISPADPLVPPLLRGLDGRRAQRTVVADAARSGLDPTTVAAVLDALRAAGLLVDVDAGDLLVSDGGPAAAARSAAELPAAASSRGRGAAGSCWRPAASAA